jgi:hypothetical protein
MSDMMGQPTGSTQEPHGLDTEGPFGSTPATPAAPSPAHRASSFDQTNTGPDSTRDVASEEARSTVEDAKASGQQVAATAKEQAGQVAGEAKGQAKEVLNQARRELADQASSQHQRAAGGLHSLADELENMGSGVSTSGVATDLAQQASSKARELARWLETREPGDLLEEARSFARRRPGMFLAGAAVLGLVGGRLTRGAADEARDDSGAADYASYTETTAAPVVGTAPVASTPPVSSTAPVTGTDPLTGTTPGTTTGTDPLTGTTPGTDPVTGTGLGGPTQSSTEGFTR